MGNVFPTIPTQIKPTILRDEDLSCYSNKIESVSLRKRPRDH